MESAVTAQVEITGANVVGTDVDGAGVDVPMTGIVDLQTAADEGEPARIVASGRAEPCGLRLVAVHCDTMLWRTVAAHERLRDGDTLHVGQWIVRVHDVPGSGAWCTLQCGRGPGAYLPVPTLGLDLAADFDGETGTPNGARLSADGDGGVLVAPLGHTGRACVQARIGDLVPFGCDLSDGQRCVRVEALFR